MFTLVDEAKLSDIPEVEDPEIQASVEGLFLPSSNLEVKSEGNETTDTSERATSPIAVAYTITPLNSGSGNLISFYLNVLNLTSQAINQFVMLCDALITEKDALMVHLCSVLYCEEAETIYNAILDCKAKKKIAGVPYTLNTAAFFPALACDYIIPFDLAFHNFDVPSIKAGGKLRDAKNSYEYDTQRKLRMLGMVQHYGFIKDEEMDNIVERQGCISLFGEKRDEAVNKFNHMQK